MHCKHNSGGCVVVGWTMLVVFSGCAWAKYSPEARIQPTQWLYPTAAFSSKGNTGGSWRAKHFFSWPSLWRCESSLISHSWVHEGRQTVASLCAEPRAWFPIAAGLTMTHQHLGLSLWLSRPVKRHAKWDHDTCGESKSLRPGCFLFIIPTLTFFETSTSLGHLYPKALTLREGTGRGKAKVLVLMEESDVKTKAYTRFGGSVARCQQQALLERKVPISACSQEE